MLNNKKLILKMLPLTFIAFTPIIFASCSVSTKEETLKEYFEKLPVENILKNIVLNSVSEEKSINYVIWNIEDWKYKKTQIESIEIENPKYQNPENPNSKEVEAHNKEKKIFEQDKKEIIDFVDKIVNSEFLEKNTLILAYDIKRSRAEYFKYDSYKIDNGKLTINAIFPQSILEDIGAKKIVETTGEMFNQLTFIKIPKTDLTKEAAENFSLNEIKNWKNFLKYKKNNPL